MKHSHTDDRYFDCSHSDSKGARSCLGKMEFFDFDTRRNKEAVYRCSVCKRMAGESELRADYGKMKMSD